MNLIALFFAAAVVNNMVFARFLGTCPFLGVSNKTDSAVGMGLAVTFVMLLSSIFTWGIEKYLLAPFNIPFMRYVVFILVIATLVQIIEMYLKARMKKMYDAFGIYLPLITTNCTILGAAILNINYGYNFIEMVIFSVGSGLGFLLALLIMSGIRERLEYSDVPEFLKGVPIVLIIAGILALAFSAFTGMIK